MEIEDLFRMGNEAEAKEEAKAAEEAAIFEQMKQLKKKTSPFDFIESIQMKKYLISDKNAKHYTPFIVNMGLSQHVQNIGYVLESSILQANLAGMNAKIANKMQYDYLYNTIRKGKQYGTWAKVDKYQHLDLIMKTYNTNRDDAIDIIKRLTEDEIQMIVDWDANKSGGLQSKKRTK